MTWLISQALMKDYENSRSSRELAAESLAGNSLGGEPSALLRLSPTAQAFLPSDRMTAFSRLSQFGMTFAPLTEGLGSDVLTWFLEASPVRTSVSLELEQGSMGSAAGCGKSFNESFAKYDQAKCMWRTRQCSLFEDLAESLETWPSWGFMLNGECWALPIPEGITTGKESGYWATPTATDWKGSPKLQTVRKRQETHLSGVRLPEHVARQLGIDITSKLNPAWSEALMTWPLGWTDLKPLAMDKFQSWLQQHSESSAGSEAA